MVARGADRVHVCALYLARLARHRHCSEMDRHRPLQPGRYPLWGSYYLRWWIVDRFQSIGWNAMFVGTPLMSLYYRAMGAKVGRNSTIGTPYCAAFDLVSIGEGTSIGADTHILSYRVEDGHLILGQVTIGDDCFIGIHCN